MLGAMKRILFALVLGQLVGQLGWIDPLFFVTVLVLPLLTGAVAAVRRLEVVLPAALWFSAGIAMAWSDWVVNHEDVPFHLVLACLMAALAAGGFGVVRLFSRSRLAQNENVF